MQLKIFEMDKLEARSMKTTLEEVNSFCARRVMGDLRDLIAELGSDGLSLCAFIEATDALVASPIWEALKVASKQPEAIADLQKKSGDFWAADVSLEQVEADWRTALRAAVPLDYDVSKVQNS